MSEDNGKSKRQTLSQVNAELRIMNATTDLRLAETIKYAGQLAKLLAEQEKRIERLETTLGISETQV